MAAVAICAERCKRAVRKERKAKSRRAKIAKIAKKNANIAAPHHAERSDPRALRVSARGTARRTPRRAFREPKLRVVLESEEAALVLHIEVVILSAGPAQPAAPLRAARPACAAGNSAGACAGGAQHRTHGP